MRNKYRINTILDKIEAIWINNPDIRLGQLLVNLAPPRLNNDIFYWEDTDLEVALDNEINRILKKKEVK